MASRYQVTRILGRGGSGVVFRATNLVTGKQVALKWPHSGRRAGEAAVERLFAEARLCARFRHPGVVDVYDVAEHDGAFFLVMECVGGSSLSALLGLRGRLAEAEVRSMLQDAIAGLSAVHAAGVVHGDISPANIIIVHGSDRLGPASKVVDFGVAQAPHDPPSVEFAGHLVAGWVGTPSCMAPEQFEPGAKMDSRTDVYSLGALLYRAVSGSPPFADRCGEAMAHKVRHLAPPDLAARRPGLSAGLLRVVKTAMQKDPSARYQNAGLMWQALYCEQALPRTTGADLFVEPDAAADTAGVTDRGLPKGLGWGVEFTSHWSPIDPPVRS